MARLNTSLGNQYGFGQAMQNAEMQNRYGLGALQGAGDVYGNMLSQTNPYYTAMIQMMAGIPQSQYQAGLLKRDAPVDWLTSTLDPMLKIGTAGSPSGGAGGSGFNTQNAQSWGDMFNMAGGKLWDAWKSRSSGSDPLTRTYDGPW